MEFADWLALVHVSPIVIAHVNSNLYLIFGAEISISVCQSLFINEGEAF